MFVLWGVLVGEPLVLQGELAEANNILRLVKKP
jgi:hypothetical protein